MENPILLFDNICNLCNGFVRFVLRNETDDQIKFISIHSKQGQQIIIDYAIEQKGFESIIFIENGTVSERSAAVLKIFSHLKYPWKIFTLAEWVPSFLRDGCYSIVSRNRYKIFGKSDNCKVTPEKWKERFLEN